MKRMLKAGLISLFLLLLLFSGITLHTLVQSQQNGRLINYVGIVRGATQRLVKLELMGRRSDELIAYLDGILLELTGNGGGYGLPTPQDEAYQQNLTQLNRMWGDIKEGIVAYRGDGGSASQLLDLSESYFVKANDTVFSAEAFSARQTRNLLIACLAMFGIMLLTWLLLLVAFAKNLLRLEDKNKALSDLTRRDALTGVYLLEAFKDNAQRLLDTLEDEKYAIVYTDFADFKYVNDVFGYAYGDSILARYGEIIRAQLRENELAGRVSADNFVLLLRYRDREEVAARQRAADNAITAFMRQYYDGQSVPTCCGICCVEDVVEELKIDGLLDRANFARKTTKNHNNHMNYVYYNESIRNRLRSEKDIENRMAGALARREFVVYYQPKVDLRTGEIGCAEALVRWKSRGGEIIPPDRFIPAFERNFLIGQLDQYVFEEVCRWLRHLLDGGEAAMPVSVNVSRLQFYNPNFVEKYVAIRNQYRIPPRLLEIEFTESIAFDNAGLMVRIVKKLKEAGFTCSIDDFGKGYSSLGLLKELPIDVLKIDGMFFQEGPDKERDMAIVRSIVELVKELGIKTVAEGIERPAQVERLREIGCDYVQGYVYYRPLPQQEYESLLQGRRDVGAAGGSPAG